MSARHFVASALAAALLAGSAAASAQGKPMDDAALSDTWGQALLDLTNTSQGGYDFSRITLNADIKMSSSLTGLVLGTHADGSSDINISALNFGRSDLDDAHRTVAIANPYFEWVYSGTAAAGDRQVVGMRVGFGGITGDVGLLMNTVSGSLTLDTGASTGQAKGVGSQLSSLSACNGACTVALNQIGGVTAGNADGPSRDFFLSILKAAVTYPTTATGVPVSATAQAGFWLNWTDRLAALNTTGSVPPNVPKIGP